MDRDRSETDKTVPDQDEMAENAASTPALADERKARLAANLRANLRRRKSQARKIRNADQ